MLKEVVNIEVPYEKAGLSGEGCKPVLECYYSTLTEEIGRKNRPAVIILPGGGYSRCSERESEPVAIRFLAYGINCFVLKYSCVNKKFPLPALECAEAVRYVRNNAVKYDINPDKIILCGFSAGGHLAGYVSNMWESSTLTVPLGCTGDDIRINGSILCYSVLTSKKGHTHEGTIINALGGAEDEKSRKELSVEDKVNANTPPAFLWHCADDGVVPVENSLWYMEKLSENHIPFECHIYEKGGHGLALCDNTTANCEKHYQPVASGWAEMAKDWIIRL